MDLSLIVILVVVTALAFDAHLRGSTTPRTPWRPRSPPAPSGPKVAVIIAGALNLVGAFLSVEVAKTISSGLVNDALISPVVIFAGLVGAILWNLAHLAVRPAVELVPRPVRRPDRRDARRRGHQRCQLRRRADEDRAPRGDLAAARRGGRPVATYLAYRITARADDGTTKQGFKVGQIVSASMVALAHGTNDAQKTMGIITLTLITAGVLAPNSGPPFWVILTSGLAIALGTYAGGWRIIQTLGKRVSEIQTPQGFAAETSAATVILTSSHLGFALSTTQVPPARSSAPARAAASPRCSGAWPGRW